MHILLAKSRSEIDGSRMSLDAHHMDTSLVAKSLITEKIPQSVITASRLSYEELEQLVIFTAALHDIGKATPAFQAIITADDPSYRDTLARSGLPVLGGGYNGKTPHPQAGFCILKSLGIPDQIATIIAGHHGDAEKISKMDQLMITYPSNFQTEGAEYPRAWKDILDNALNLSGSTISSLMEIDQKITCETQSIVCGIVIEADWIASSEALFPYICTALPYKDWEVRTQAALKRLLLPDGWKPALYAMDSKAFTSRFDGYTPRPTQEDIFSVINNVLRPGIYTLEAPTGLGKTEAALAIAEVLATKFGLNGEFIGLPTQATANGLFPRLVSWAKTVSEGTLSSIKLAHGGASFNPIYAKYIEESILNTKGGEDIDGIMVNPWFEGKKSLLSDFVVGTVDQLLMMSLKKKHYMLKHLGLAKKVVIVDEVHAYDAYMCEYLISSIQWLAAYGVPVILLSATLPLEKRKSLTQAYAKAYAKYHRLKYKADDSTFMETAEEYPLLTWTDGPEIHFKALAKPELSVTSLIKRTDNVIATLKTSLSNGGSACVIMNTVRSAQKMRKILKAAFPNHEILLYHSKFTVSDRNKKETEIMDRLGKRSTAEQRNNVILIGTQVLEQSLDYDADIMLTQICPIDLLLQRLGRLHRHKRIRPEKLKEPVCYIIDHKDTDTWNDGTLKVYSKYIIGKTSKTLPDKITVPADVPRLVKGVYDDPEPNMDGYDEWIAATKGEEAKAKGYLLTRDARVTLKYAGGSTIAGALDIEDISDESQAAVRDTNENLTLILVKIEEDGNIRPVSSEISYSTNTSPSTKESMEILGSRISIDPTYLPFNIRNYITDVPAGWSESKFLAGEKMMILDENCPMSYSFDIGLTY